MEAGSITGYEAGGRCTPRGRVIGDSFSVDQNSKMRIAGQVRERAGPYPENTCFSFLKSGDLPDHT